MASHLAVKILSDPPQTIEMAKDDKGFWEATAESVGPGARYLFVLNGDAERPDPASRFQPEGVDGPSEVVDPSAFGWDDDEWQGIEPARMIIYEIHVGAFTQEGTLDAIIPRLAELRGLGVNTIELMPLAQFSGERNWGYDGAYPYAVHNTYGGPEAFKRLVNSAHSQGIAVILDAVYNHMESEGNYLSDFGPYFSTGHRTMWGRSLNFDREHSGAVRGFFLENAIYWFREFHIDALRLDAADAIFDHSPKHFLKELSESVQAHSDKAGRRFYLIGETDDNDPDIIRSMSDGGYGLDAQWCDDFHHALHTFLTGDRRGYYVDFGRFDQVVRTLREGYVYQGEYSEYRKRDRGHPPADRPAGQFVVFSQNHDQVGNRLGGKRLLSYTSFETGKLAAAVVILSPFVPLLFMGEEYGEESPFLFFVDHLSSRRIEAARRGRKQTLESFGWDEVPADPKSAGTFLKSRLRWDLRTQGKHRTMLEYYSELIKIRRATPALAEPDRENLEVGEVVREKVILMRRWRGRSEVMCLMNFVESPVMFSLEAACPAGDSLSAWRKTFDSSDLRWSGPGALMPDELGPGITLTMNPRSAALYQMLRPGRGEA